MSSSETSYLRDVHSGLELSKKHKLYLRLFKEHPELFGDSIMDVGAGVPVFLEQTPFARKIAVDNDAHYAASFEAQGIEFLVRDLDREDLAAAGSVDVVICSDVFEHLLYPLNALKSIAAVLRPRGVLLSHVPNEYRLKKTLQIMLGRSEGMYYHQNMNEWDDPHLRRFTDVGFRKFLSQAFAHNLRLNALAPASQERLLNRLGLKAPICVTAGATYLSTNDPSVAERLRQAYAGYARFM